MGRAREAAQSRTNTQVRELLLRYFYDRNRNSTSSRGKKGSAVRISDVKRELKAQAALSQQEIHSNLTYLLSQGWVSELSVEKEFRTPTGTVMPSVTLFFQITAAGIDKIEGPGEFSMPKFHGIKIEATGQNIITVGDGNQINARFKDLGSALADLREAVVRSEESEAAKMNVVADIETIQAQLAKATPNRGIVSSAWTAIKGAAVVAECIGLVDRVAGYISPFL
jgi:hypothetical protein